MRRIFSDYAYGSGPRLGCWWDETCDLPVRPALAGAHSFDVAIIGAGITGLSAALHLARAGIRTAVLDAQYPGWGASGRNGGFCCLGGGMLSDAELDRRFGRDGRLAFRRTEKAAVTLVSELVETLGLEVDRHSEGETELAHRPKDMADLRQKAQSVEENYSVAPRLIEAAELEAEGMAGPFHGALTVPLGFGLNPLKYLLGLTSAAETAGARIFHNSPVGDLRSDGGMHQLVTENGTARAPHVIVATNGYSSENLPRWLAGRYMPGQSNVLVTRPLRPAEITAQGWHSGQMSYDTRCLLHYFRLMPDRRFLFGMRGGVLTGRTAERRARRRMRRDFAAMFPAWAHVDATHMWSGMVCLARDRLPFVGEISAGSGLWAGLCYHGNGVAMGTFSGKMLAERISGQESENYAEALQQPLGRFPLGRGRRLLMPPIYAGLMLSDRL